MQFDTVSGENLMPSLIDQPLTLNKSYINVVFTQFYSISVIPAFDPMKGYKRYNQTDNRLKMLFYFSK